MKYNMATLKRLQKNGKQDLLKEAWKRHLLKSVNNCRKQRPKTIKSLSDEPHYLVPESNYESVYEFWIEEAQGRTDEELQEYCDEMEVHNNTPYDCSGLMCTCYISWYRNKSGLISFVHKKNLDV